MNRLYRAWCRSAVTAQCNPAAILGVLAAIAVIALVSRYSAALAEAARVAFACLLTLAGLALPAAAARYVTLAGRRPAVPSGIAADADVLAEEKVSIRMTPDGRDMEVVRRP
jgi:hypothetical protein